MLSLHVLGGGSISIAAFCVHAFKRKIFDNIYLELKMNSSLFYVLALSSTLMSVFTFK